MRAHIKAFFLVLVIPALGLTVLAGCGKKGPPLPPLPEGPPPAEKPENGARLRGAGETAGLMALNTPTPHATTRRVLTKRT